MLFTVLLPALALLGPNQIYDWMFPASPVREAPPVAVAEHPDSSHAMYYAERDELPASTTAPVLSAEASIGPELDETRASAQQSQNGGVQRAAHAEAAEAQAAAEYRFRESAGESRDQMQQIQQRLQLLGASYMVLETWGDVAPSYRFYCRLPRRGRGESEFESVCGDPVEAMQRVLGQVEAQVARRP